MCCPLRSLDAPGNLEIIHLPLFSNSHMAEILNVTQLLICWFTHISKEHEYHWQLLKKTKETKIHPNSQKKKKKNMIENIKYLLYFLNLCFKQNCVRYQAAWEKFHKFFCLKSFIKILHFFLIPVKDMVDLQEVRGLLLLYLL